MESNKEYFAFISYQREDEKWAKWLQHKLEHYKLPSNLNGRTDFPKAIRPIFRDASELTPGNLPQQIHKALEQSKYLIVICSPRSARSEWVNKEVETFISMGKTANVIPFIIEGTAFSKNDEEECFPLALRQLPEEQEILGADINEMGRDAAAVKVVACMFDVKFDSLWQRHEREMRRQRWIRMGGLTAFAVAVLCVAIWIGHQNVLLKEKDWKMMENQARAVADMANRLIDEGDAYKAQLLALEILPSDLNNPDRPYIGDAEKVLRTSLQKKDVILSCNNSIFIDIAGDFSHPSYATFDPTGKKIAVCNMFSASVYDFETGKDLCELTYIETSIKNKLRFLAFSSDSQWMITYGGYGNSLIAKDIETGDYQILNLEGNDSLFTSIAYNKERNLLACANERDIKIFKGVQSSNKIQWESYFSMIKKRTIDLTSSKVKDIEFSPDGKKLLSISDDGIIREWDVQSGVCLNEIKERSKRVNSVRYSPIGNFILSSSDKNVRIWDITNGKIIHELEGHKSDVSIAVFSDDGKYVASGSKDGIIRIWNTEEATCLKILNAKTNELNSLNFSPDNKYIVSAFENSSVRIWNIEEMANIPSSEDCCYAMISPDDKNVVSITSSNKVVRLLNIDNNTVHSLGENVSSAFFSSNGENLVTVSHGKPIRIWNVETGKCILELVGHTDKVCDVSYTKDGKRIVSVANNGEICFWDAKTGRCLKKEMKNFLIKSILFNQNDTRIVSINGGNSAIEWSANQTICRLLGHTSILNSVEYNSSGNLIVTSSDDKTVRIWNADNGDCLHVLKGHTKKVCTASFSPNSDYVISVSEDNTIRVWNVDSEICVQMHTLENSILSAKFSVGGNQIIAITKDNRIHYYDFPPLQELIDKTRERFKNRKLTPEERRKYYLE